MLKKTSLALAILIGAAIAQPGAAQQPADDGLLFGQAIANADPSATRALIADGRNVNAFLPGSDGKTTHVTPLIYAAMLKQRDIARVLVDAGADASFLDEGSRSALSYAVINQDRELVRLLAPLPGSQKVIDTPNSIVPETSLRTAVGLYDTEIVRILLDAGASPEAKDISGQTVREACATFHFPACEGLDP